MVYETGSGYAQLIVKSSIVRFQPAFDDLALGDAKDHHPGGLDFVHGRLDTLLQLSNKTEAPLVAVRFHYRKLCEASQYEVTGFDTRNLVATATALRTQPPILNLQSMELWVILAPWKTK